MLWVLGLVLVLDPLNVMDADHLSIGERRKGYLQSLWVDFIGFGVKLKWEIEPGYPFEWVRNITRKE